MLSAIEELRFWTGIMRDHGEFIYGSLSGREKEAANTALYFENSYAALHNEVKGVEAPLALNNILSSSMTLLIAFSSFKQKLLRKSLECNIESSLSPSLFNLMLNEDERFYLTLCRLQTGVFFDPVKEIIELNRIWLADAAGHAGIAAVRLDELEAELIKEAEEFADSFNKMYIKTVELGIMVERACLGDGRLLEFNREIKVKINEFICYLKRLLELRRQCKALGTLTPRMADHMIREEEHYLATLKLIEKLIL